MSETKYRYVYDDLSGIMEPDDRDTEPSTRYRVENGRLVYDPEPEPPKPARIDEERWAYIDNRTGTLTMCVAGYIPDRFARSDFFQVRVRDKAADDALVEQAERYKHKDDVRSLKEQLRRLANLRDDLQGQVATLTRERDEAQQTASAAMSTMRDVAAKEGATIRCQQKEILDLERQVAELKSQLADEESDIAAGLQAIEEGRERDWNDVKADLGMTSASSGGVWIERNRESLCTPEQFRTGREWRCSQCRRLTKECRIVLHDGDPWCLECSAGGEGT